MLRLLYPYLVVHLFYTRNLLGHIFGPALGVAILNRAGKGHLPRHDGHFNFGRINVRVIGQALAHVLADAVVGALPAFRASP